MKQSAKESFIKVLTKACTNENMDINLQELSDKELKDLYLKLQAVQRGTLPYGIAKGEEFVSAMENGRLQLVTFKDTYKFGVRRLTFKEWLLLTEFAAQHPNMYPFIHN